MKRLLALALALLMLAGCSTAGQSGAQTAEPTGSQPSASEPTLTGSQEPEIKDPEPDNDTIVQFTVDGSFFDEGITQEELDESTAESGFISATLNEDGSVTYTMTKAAHTKFMEELAQTIKSGLDEIAASEDYSTISKVEAEAPFVEFRVYLDAEEVGLMESFTVLAFYVYGGMYNAFNGTEIDDIAVYFISNATGDIIQESHSSDAN